MYSQLDIPSKSPSGRILSDAERVFARKQLEAHQVEQSLEFIRSWYQTRPIQPNQILEEFRFESLTIRDYLAPFYSEKAIKEAISIFRDHLFSLQIAPADCSKLGLCTTGVGTAQ